MEKNSRKDSLISVIIPLYNKGPYVARAIESVLKQTIQNFDIIVIDGDSHDDGPKIVKDLNDSRIHFLVQSGKGVSNARNEAVNFSKNDFVAFLDADDEWMPKHLETIQRLLEKFPEAGMYSTAYTIRTNDGKMKQVDYQNIPIAPWEGLLPDYFKSGALGDYPLWTSVVVIPRKIFHEVGGFPEGYWWAEDADLFGKIALKYPVAFSWELGAIYHWDAENRACDKIETIGSLDIEDEPFIKTARAALMKREVPPKFIESLNEYIARRELGWAERYLYAGKSDKARALLKQCNTKWFRKEKKKLWFLVNIRYPLTIFLGDIRSKLYNLIRKIYPSFKNGK